MTTSLNKLPRVIPTLLLSLATACDDGAAAGPSETLQTERVIPDLGGDDTTVDSYSGQNAIVLAAEHEIFDGFALHARVIKPTCAPIDGVCHNAKEYPDLRTPETFLGTVGAPCNVQSGTEVGVYDRCERPGDRLRLGSGEADLEIAFLDYIPGEHEGEEQASAETPGLHIYVMGTLSAEEGAIRSDAQFVRSFVDEGGKVKDLPFFTFGARYELLGTDSLSDGEPRSHLYTPVAEYQRRALESLLSVGVVEGDANRNGVLGARIKGNPISMIVAGDPEQSYLVGRMRGALGGDAVPGSRMPLANEPLDSMEMLSLYCFIEGLAELDGAVSMDRPIDYENCSFSSRPEDLEMLGAGVTWGGRIKRILEFNCGGCHSAASPQGGLDLKDGDVFSRILEPSAQSSLKLIEPGQPLQSYLWLKLIGDPSISGQAMPIDPLSGERTLTPQELSDMRTWIEEGALPGGEEALVDEGDTATGGDGGETAESGGAGASDPTGGTDQLESGGSTVDPGEMDAGAPDPDTEPDAG